MLRTSLDEKKPTQHLIRFMVASEALLISTSLYFRERDSAVKKKRKISLDD